jgi:hypothetical protein
MLAFKLLFLGMTTRSVKDRPGSHLVRNVIALATGSALLAGTAARADDPLLLATGGVYGGMTQNYAVCYVFNAGKSPVAVLMEIRDQLGGFAGAPTSTVVLPGRISAVANFVVNNEAYSCTIKGTPVTANLRGGMDVRDVDENVLIYSDLR